MELIKAGKLVVLPTETVYGIAVNLASGEAREAARRIKKLTMDANAPLPPPPRWVVHVAQPEQVLQWAGDISALGKRLISKSMPGPVAFDIKLSPAAAEAARKRLGDAADETLAEGRITLRCRI